MLRTSALIQVLMSKKSDKCSAESDLAYFFDWIDSSEKNLRVQKLIKTYVSVTAKIFLRTILVYCTLGT
jgi:hypothetical protein